MRSVPQGPGCLNTWLPLGGAVWGGGTALLKELCP